MSINSLNRDTVSKHAQPISRKEFQNLVIPCLQNITANPTTPKRLALKEVNVKQRKRINEATHKRLQEKANSKAKLDQAKKFTDYSDVIYDCYVNAFKGVFPFKILGGEAVRKDPAILANFGVISNEPLISKVIVFDSKELYHKGSVLSDKNWSIYKNDAFILGVIHARQIVHVTSENGNIENDDLFDTQNNRYRLLGREVTMLHHGGYRNIMHSNTDVLGFVFACVFPQDAENVTFKSLMDSAEEAPSLDRIRAIFKDSYPLVDWNSHVPAGDETNEQIPPSNENSVQKSGKGEYKSPCKGKISQNARKAFEEIGVNTNNLQRQYLIGAPARKIY